MVKTSDNSGLNPVKPVKAVTNNALYLDTIQNWLKQIAGDGQIANYLTQEWQVEELQLGDEVIVYTNKALATTQVHSEQNSNYFYLICLGKVRLLGFDPQQEREVCTQVLQAGETFGSENLYNRDRPQLTRALAASQLRVAKISLSRLRQWFEQILNLGEHIWQQVQQRQCWVFFKTATQMRSLPSHQIQQMLPDIKAIRIDRGKLLITEIPLDRGCCWLRQGEIQTQLPTPPPQIEPQPIAYPRSLRQIVSRRFWQALSLIQQQSSSDCSAACLATIALFWGKRFSINTLRNLADVDRGASLKGLAKAAETLGFHASSVRASLSRLESLDFPWIAHWQGNHYVVIYRVKGDRVLVADPASRKKWLPRQEFVTHWTEYALLLEPTERLQATANEKFSRWQFWGAVLPYRSLIGRSGSGKSTLVRLLPGLYHPTNGRILIDGHEIRHVSPQSLRSQIGVVPQECFLFSGTILENITLYRSEFALEQVTEVAKLAEAHGFIQDLPLGYNTQVGERGTALSGGQRQRIAIARALLGNPRILVLDEATSSLDTESERRFQQNLPRICRDRTTFIIAHRLSTVRHADNILVLDRSVLASGTHEQLMAQQGIYYHLAAQQLDL